MISALNRLSDGTIELTITIPWKKVTEEYQKSLTKLAKNTAIKGFRKGKAPIKKVEENLGKSAIYEEVLKTLIPFVYIEALKKHNLKPIINPQITVISLQENKDWQIKATTCEIPKVDLGDYQEAVRKTLASEKIWTPAKDKTKPPLDQKDESVRLEKIFKTLLTTANVQIPEILIQDEVNRMLSRLIDQTGKLGLTVEQYLASIGKTSEQIRGEYYQQAEESLKLELILATIADEQKIEISEDEVQKLIQAVPDEETKKSLDTQTQKAYIRQLLRKRRAIDNLSKL
jgi:FKBP-type peptidyl-prolyl cis-trans isomerase (trigger factor)